MWLWFPEGPDGIVGALRRGEITATDDSGAQQLVNVNGLASESMTKVVRALPHGFSSHAPAGADGLLLSLGGRSDRAMLIGGQHTQYRQKNLPAGAAVLYDHKGNIVFVRTDKGVAIDASKGKIYVKPQDGQNVYLGGKGPDEDSHLYAPVSTTAGPSVNVFARYG